MSASSFPTAAPLPRPVVLVHGWDSDGTALADNHSDPIDKLGGLLDVAKTLSAPVKTFAFDYGANAARWASRPQIASCLADYINTVSAAYKAAGGDGKVLAVGHSMGGLAIGYATDPRYAAHPAGDALAGVVTIDTPFLGSPWGDTAYAQLVQTTKHGVEGLLPLPPGGDAQTCLAQHTGATGMPMGCDIPAWLPPNVPLAEIGGDITVYRLIMGFEVSHSDTGGDAIVTTGSSFGYPTSGSGTPPVGAATPTRFLDRCDVTTGQLEEGPGGYLVSIGSSAYSFVMGLGTLKDQPLDAGAENVFAAADIVAPCSHTNIIGPDKDPYAARDVITAINADLSRLNAATSSDPLVVADSVGIELLTGTKLTTLARGYAFAPSWSADGKWLSWASGDPFNNTVQLHTVNRAGGGQRSWACGARCIGPGRWVGDVLVDVNGSELVVADPESGSLHHIPIAVPAGADGDMLGGTAQAAYVALPDPRGVAAYGGPEIIYKATLSGTLTRVVEDGSNTEIGGGQTDPTGRLIAFVTDGHGGQCQDYDALTVLDTTTGTETTAALPNANYGDALVSYGWQPDGTLLAGLATQPDAVCGSQTATSAPVQPRLFQATNHALTYVADGVGGKVTNSAGDSAQLIGTVLADGVGATSNLRLQITLHNTKPMLVAASNVTALQWAP